jgi:hypothetical protein
MTSSLVKAVKRTHRHPLNKTLHIIGLTLYAFALFTLVSHLIGNHDQNPVLSLTLWLTAINLFITGHAIENNVGAMTATVLYKFLRARLYRNGLNRWPIFVSNQ